MDQIQLPLTPHVEYHSFLRIMSQVFLRQNLRKLALKILILNSHGECCEVFD